MADKKRRAPVPPSHPLHGSQTGGSQAPVREINNPAYVEVDGSQQGKKISLPLPDYETLFPQRRHGVQGQTRWDHIIAEVSQRNRDAPPELLGPEMSVDGPEECEPRLRSSLSQESPAVRHYQTQPQETKPVSSKKAPAPAPPKAAAHPPSQSVTDSSQSKRQNIDPQFITRPLAFPGAVNTDSSSRESLQFKSRDGARKVLHPSPAAAQAPRPTHQTDSDTTTLPADQRKAQVTVNKEAPTAKPRQRVSGQDPVQKDFAATPVLSDKNSYSDIQPFLNSGMKIEDKKVRQTKENITEFDPFPSSELISKDPWAQLKQNQEVDNLFTGSVQKEKRLEDQGMTADDLDNIFSQDRPADPFEHFNGRESDKHTVYREKEEVSKQVSPAFQRRNSQRQKQSLPYTSHSGSKASKPQQEPAYKEETTTTIANQGPSARTVTNESLTPKLPVFHVGEDPFGREPFTVTSASTSMEPLQVVMEEPASQAGGVSGGKALLRAEVQPVSAQNSNGGGLAFNPRRPHPVKPLSTAENQYPISTPAVKEIKVRDSTPGKIQVADSALSGPYTQLTQEELITLVVKQQTDLSRKDAKIVELEEYIDNLLVRVIEEKPAILQSINSTKPV